MVISLIKAIFNFYYRKIYKEVVQPRSMKIENIKIEQNHLSGIEDIEQILKNLPPMEIDSSGRLRAYMGLANIII